ncbi:MAG: hypothetical protein AAGC57_13830 [Pseudomonadota bacterium]
MTLLRRLPSFLLLVLSACSGIKGASDYSERTAFETTFEPVSLVEQNEDPNRILTVFVFSGPPTQDGKARPGYEVKITAGPVQAR